MGGSTGTVGRAHRWFRLGFRRAVYMWTSRPSHRLRWRSRWAWFFGSVEDVAATGVGLVAIARCGSRLVVECRVGGGVARWRWGRGYLAAADEEGDGLAGHHGAER